MRIAEFPEIRGYLLRKEDSPLFELNFYERTSMWGRNLHEHDYVQIFTVTQGEVKLVLEDQVFTYKEGMTSIVPPGIKHVIYSETGYSQIGVNVAMNLGSLFGITERLKKIKTPQTVYGISFAEREDEVISLLANASYLDVIHAQVLFCEYLVEILKKIEYGDQERFDQRLTAFISANLDKKLKIEDISAEFSYSPAQLQRMCRQYFGTSLMGLFNHQRMAKARQRLFNTNDSVSDIAKQLGFDETSNFSNFFSKREGTTPSEFRRKMRGASQQIQVTHREVNTMNITALIEKIHRVVESHKIADGVYSRYLWNNEEGSRKMGINEYGCADAANILYSIGQFPGDPDERKEWIRVLKEMQDPKTGLYYEGTHHTIHTTAHCIAALELFDAYPDYPLTDLLQYLDKDKLYAFLDQLDWANSPWNNSHQGAGLFAAMAITRTADLQWKNDYFAWLSKYNDPETGLGVIGHEGNAPLAHQLYGWFHYFFNHEYAHMPIPNPEKLIDSCIKMYTEKQLASNFGTEVGFMEIDWIFAMNRASRQTKYRFDEVQALLWDMAQSYIAYLEGLDEKTDDGLNDLHMLFGAVCAIAELQIALPGKIQSEIPLKLVLDRRPFI